MRVRGLALSAAIPPGAGLVSGGWTYAVDVRADAGSLDHIDVR
jgi:hypothetical protein